MALLRGTRGMLTRWPEINRARYGRWRSCLLRETPEFSNPDVWPDTPYIHFGDEIAFVVAGLFQGDGDRLSIA